MLNRSVVDMNTLLILDRFSLPAVKARVEAYDLPSTARPPVLVPLFYAFPNSFWY
jgi:hypothetical protein